MIVTNHYKKLVMQGEEESYPSFTNDKLDSFKFQNGEIDSSKYFDLLSNIVYEKIFIDDFEDGKFKFFTKECFNGITSELVHFFNSLQNPIENYLNYDNITNIELDNLYCRIYDFNEKIYNINNGLISKLEVKLRHCHNGSIGFEIMIYENIKGEEDLLFYYGVNSSKANAIVRDDKLRNSIERKDIIEVWVTALIEIFDLSDSYDLREMAMVRYLK